MPEPQLQMVDTVERLGAPIPSAKPRAASFAWPIKIDPMQLSVQIFADGADKSGMLKQYANPLIKGFTTNPTLMRRAGITDYEAFARDIIEHIPDRPISLEVFSDDFDEMYAQAIKIAAWGKNVYVKVR
jgi:transaldolase